MPRKPVLPFAVPAAAKLDVFVLTDHLEHIDDEEWLDTREVAFDFNEDEHFVATSPKLW